MINPYLPNYFLDWKAEIAIRNGGNLPHWNQPEKIHYVTFRLADSLSQDKVLQLKQLANDFKSEHHEPWDNETSRQFRMLMSAKVEKLLDNGYGSCILRDKGNRFILTDSLHYKNKIDYHLIGYVIMPNHVHLLIKPYEDVEVSDVLGSVKKFTARRINKRLKKEGTLWMRESFDHIIRNFEEFVEKVFYIKNNPVNLPVNEYDLFMDSDFLRKMGVEI